MPSPSASTTALPPASGLLRRDAAWALVRTALLLLVAAMLATLAAGFGAWFVPKALALFGAGAVLVWQGLAAHAPHARFGAANGITLLRLALIALLAAAAGEPALHAAGAPALAWSAVVLATATALLDAVDGPLARRQRQASAFGARFDMETDALLILVLSVLVLHLGKAGAWVLASGAMRYAYVLAARAWPWLARPLPPSGRRKTVCVLQIVLLIVCLGPIISPLWSSLLAAAGLVALTYSFAVDIVWLARRRHGAQETSA